ncbi:MAG TPA: hypothetical protein VK119_11295 [Bacillota bacterium]|nr:hypothetical protein [Bacillota bacterium]
MKKILVMIFVLFIGSVVVVPHVFAQTGFNEVNDQEIAFKDSNHLDGVEFAAQEMVTHNSVRPVNESRAATSSAGDKVLMSGMVLLMALSLIVVYAVERKKIRMK